jgi:hypothetical protein
MQENSNQPPTLRDKSMMEFRKNNKTTLTYWILELCAAGNKGLYNYSNEVDSTLIKCEFLNQDVTSLPTHILRDLVPLLVPDFVTIISSYHKTFLGMKRIRKHAKEIQEDICTEMVKCLLGPSTRRLNTGTMSSFGLRLIIQAFNKTPNLSHLVCSTAPRTDNGPLAINIYKLKNLIKFQYNYRCTDQVIQQLTLHCSKLRVIDVSNSRAVTHVSVKQLLKLKDLCQLDLTGTSVTDRQYGVLKSRFPNITIKHHSTNM